MAEFVAALAACAVSYGCGALWDMRGVLVAAAVAAALAIIGGSVVPALLVTAAPWAVARLVSSRRRLAVELADRNRALAAEQDALAAEAVRHERARIARELHDIVAHHVAVMVIQAGAGRMDTSGASDRFAVIRDSGHEALGELDRLVELLEARPRDLEALLDHARAAGVQLQYTPPPDGVDVPPDVQDGAYRVVQEGLTNAMKHASGSDVVVRLDVHAQALEVEVRDGGSTARSPLAASGAGLGLAGMRERVEALGGVLEAGPHADGWRLHARLPLRTSTG